jgi:hypothetical protein
LVTADNLFYLKYFFSTHDSLFPWAAAPLATAPLAVPLPVDCDGDDDDDDDDDDEEDNDDDDDETFLLAFSFSLLLYSPLLVSRDATTSRYLKISRGYHHEHVYERSS